MSYSMTTLFSKSEHKPRTKKKIDKYTRKSFVFFFSSYFQKIPPAVVIGKNGGVRTAPITASDSEMFKTVQGHHNFFFFVEQQISVFHLI